MAVQRRLAAILAADVAGYSRLMGEDEEGTLATLTAHRTELIEPCIAEHRGRVVKTTGDGLLAEFASVVDAVRCAVAFQEGMTELNADTPDNRRIEFRVGINLGDVIVQDDDVFGDGVNVAARLEGLAKPGGIVVSGKVHDEVRTKLDFGFDDLGQQEVKNIAEPVRAYKLERKGGAGGQPVSTNLDRTARAPAIAVIPFTNISGDPEQEFFADGLTEDIITSLSLWRSFPVIARNSTFSYKGQSPDIREVGEVLGARYVIEGSVRKSGNRVRITAQLINSENGHHVWAETFDRDIADLFEVQDEISNRIAATVEPELERVEQKQALAKPPANLDAWGYYQRGMSYFHDYTEEGNRLAREMCERAIEFDPNYGPAHIGLAYSYYQDIRLGYTEDVETARSRLFDAVHEAIRIDDLDARAHWILGLGYQVSGQYQQSIEETKKAIELNPNFAYFHFSLGGSYFHAGRAEDAITSLHRAIELNPRDRRNGIIFTVLAHSYLLARRYEDAALWARSAIALRPNFVEAHLVLASSLGHLDQTSDAQLVIKKCERLRPGSARSGRGLFEFQNLRGEFDPELLDNDNFLDGLRKAGLPE